MSIRIVSTFAIAVLITGLHCVAFGQDTSSTTKSTASSNVADLDAKPLDEAAWKKSLARSSALFGEGKFLEATKAARETVKIADGLFDKNDSRVAKSVLMLSSLLFQQKKMDEAEALALRGHAIKKQALKTAQSDVATTLKFLGNIYMLKGNLEEAEKIFLEAVELSEDSVGPQHSETAKHLGNLGAIYLGMKKPELAKIQFARAMEIWDNQPAYHPVYTVTTMTNLAQMSLDVGDETQALAIYQECLAIQEEAFGKDNPRLANLLRKYARLLKQIGQSEKAAAIEMRLKTLSDRG